MAKKLLPYINRFNGEIQMLTKSQGGRLSEDWARAKVVRNEKGEKVFRFHIASPVEDKNGNIVMGTAVVDISEVGETEVDIDGDTRAE